MTRVRAWLRACTPRDYFDIFISANFTIIGVGHLAFHEPRTGVYALLFAGAVAVNLDKNREIRRLRTRLKQTAKDPQRSMLPPPPPGSTADLWDHAAQKWEEAAAAWQRVIDNRNNNAGPR